MEEKHEAATTSVSPERDKLSELLAKIAPAYSSILPQLTSTVQKKAKTYLKRATNKNTSYKIHKTVTKEVLKILPNANKQQVNLISDVITLRFVGFNEGYTKRTEEIKKISTYTPSKSKIVAMIGNQEIPVPEISEIDKPE